MKLRIGSVGCAHGELNRIFERVKKVDPPLDILFCCGDFQCCRNEDDLNSMAVPPKYRRYGDFVDYFNGIKSAPCLTVFIGGNHEASNYLLPMALGGWVAPRIFYLGRSGVVRIGVGNKTVYRVGGLSGIYKAYDYYRGIYESPPLDEYAKKTAIHTRAFDLDLLRLIKGPLNVVLTHDWPVGITDYGDKNGLLQKKPHFRQDILEDKLGNPHTFDLLIQHQPDFWLSGHLHVKFDALVKRTKFVALDKVGKNRQYFSAAEVQVPDAEGELTVLLDPEWLAILRQNLPYYPTINTNSCKWASGHIHSPNSDDVSDIENRIEAIGSEWPYPQDWNTACEEQRNLLFALLSNDAPEEIDVIFDE